ncbi:sensor histidine kinase [Chloroflexi bacterium TSY]|nr:sensor histidine kinase [Chloroflexi bacterium TSY]
MLLPFLAYFVLNRWAGMVLAGLYFTWFVIYFNRFRCPGCNFDEYVSQMLVFGLALIWSVVMAGLVKSTETSRMQTQQLLVELEQSRQQLKAYADQAWELATAEERNRLARDIHDSIGHYLAGVNIQLEKALTFRQRDPAATEQAMHDAKRAAREALQDVRQSVRALRQSEEVFSLSTALTDLTARWRNGRMAITLDIEGDEAGYSKATLMALYRSVQEGLTNVHKHAQASQVQIDLNLGSESACLRLCDNGKGFDQIVDMPDSTNSGHHYGLEGIRERLAFLGGQLVIQSNPGAGTILIVTLPKAQLTGLPAAEGLV